MFQNVALALLTLSLAALTLLASGPLAAPGLPYRWEPGSVYVLAWK